MLALLAFNQPSLTGTVDLLATSRALLCSIPYSYRGRIEQLHRHLNTYYKFPYICYRIPLVFPFTCYHLLSK